MWTQPYLPAAGSLLWSAVIAAVPLLVIGIALGVWRIASWKASLLALGTGITIALFVYDMPAQLVIASTAYGAAYGFFPLTYLVYSAILLFDVTVAAGRFDGIRRSIGAIHSDPRIQSLVIAFAFGAFLEGAAGGGTPVAVTASLLAGLGFPAATAAGISLLANSAPVAFGALGLPVVTLGAITGFPVQTLSAAVGRIAPFIGALLPAYLIIVLSGLRGALAVWPALAVCGIVFALGQFFISNFIGPHLADILSSIVTVAALIGWMRVWRPASAFNLMKDSGAADFAGKPSVTAVEPQLSGRELVHAWAPYLLLVVTVVLWGAGPIQHALDRATLHVPVPFLNNSVQRTAPIVHADTPYPAVFVFNWLNAAGTACLLAALLTAAISGIGVGQFVRIAGGTARRLARAALTIMCVTALAYLMNYSGATATLGLAAATTGTLLPFFGAYLGWLGAFLTGSDTAANALFGPLQVVAAQSVHLNPILMCAVNTCGGVTGKMISIQNITIGAAATGLAATEEGGLFRFALRHSLLLACFVGLIALVYAYFVPIWMPRA